MLLAEALQERADNNRLIEQLKNRIQQNAVMQEGTPPPEDPTKLLAALDGIFDRQEKLISAINLTNSITVVGEVTLTELIAKRDILSARINAYNGSAHAASSLTNRYSRTEIAQLSALDVKTLRSKTDSLSAELRRVDTLIQKTNWTTELTEL